MKLIGRGRSRKGEVSGSFAQVHDAITAMVAGAREGRPVGVSRRIFVALVMIDDDAMDPIDTEGEAIPSLPPPSSRAA
jgi:hypothetical protein